MLLTEHEIDDLSREMVKGCKSVNWLAKKIESAVLEKLKAQAPFAYFSINDYGAWEETSDPTAHALYEHPLPPDDVVRDAERYRWLRDNHNHWSWNPSQYNKDIVSGFAYKNTGFAGYYLQEAIDAAMKGGNA